MLPEIDGLEVARTIREPSNIAYIIVYRWDTEFDKVAEKRIRANDYETFL